jgi:excisionase family DNA binding protein
MEHHTLIDANEASRLCGLSKATIYKLAHRGRLRSFRVLNRTLRFDPDDIAAVVRELPVDATAASGKVGE